MALRLFCMFKGNSTKSFCVAQFSLRYATIASKASKKSLYKREETRKFKFYVLNRYVQYLKRYESVLEKRFPSAMRVYRVFMDGIKYFYSDVKDYLRIVTMLNIKGNTLKDLSRKEIELYHQMPKDMMKVAPVLIISALPFANYIIFPVAYIFPRHLLCSHFWNLQQKSEFNREILQTRLVHNRPVFRHLQLHWKTLKEDPLYDKWGNILASIGSGRHPTTTEIIECKKLFMGKPYHILYLSGNHVTHLLKMHDMHRMWFRRSRLAERAFIIQAMDKAILKEGGVEHLPTDALRNCCLVRGLNPTNMKNEDMVSWLKLWMTISHEVDKTCWSLLLHCPVLLGYNHPSNWQLIYRTNTVI